MLRKYMNNHRGQAVVEFALVLPIFLLLFGGMIEFGRIYNESIIVTGAAREGARAAAVGQDDTVVTQTVQQFASSIDQGNLKIIISPSTRVTGQPVTVTVTNPVHIIFAPMISSILGSTTYTVQGTAVMRVE